MKTKIFKNYAEFSQRENKEINGVNQIFTDNFPDFEEDNITNKGCWNCVNCIDCVDCKDCVDCVDCIDCIDCIDYVDCVDCVDCDGEVSG